jgi:hypothetical protein
MVATVRANFARHVGDSEWTEFVRRMSAASAEFAELWASHQVAEPQPQIKIFNCPPVGIIRMRRPRRQEARPTVRLPLLTATPAASGRP